MEFRRPKNCPNCGATKFREILYGRPTAEAWDAIDRGEITLGGCFIMPGQPDWECVTCGRQWFDANDPARLKWDKLIRDLTDADSEEQNEA